MYDYSTAPLGQAAQDYQAPPNYPQQLPGNLAYQTNGQGQSLGPPGTALYSAGPMAEEDAANRRRQAEAAMAASYSLPDHIGAAVRQSLVANPLDTGVLARAQMMAQLGVAGSGAVGPTFAQDVTGANAIRQHILGYGDAQQQAWSNQAAVKHAQDLQAYHEAAKRNLAQALNPSYAGMAGVNEGDVNGQTVAFGPGVSRMGFAQGSALGPVQQQYMASLQEAGVTAAQAAAAQGVMGAASAAKQQSDDDQTKKLAQLTAAPLVTAKAEQDLQALKNKGLLDATNAKGGYAVQIGATKAEGARLGLLAKNNVDRNTIAAWSKYNHDRTMAAQATFEPPPPNVPLDEFIATSGLPPLSAETRKAAGMPMGQAAPPAVVAPPQQPGQPRMMVGPGPGVSAAAGGAGAGGGQGSGPPPGMPASTWANMKPASQQQFRGLSAADQAAFIRHAGGK